MLEQLLSFIYSWHTPIRDAFLDDVGKLSPEQLLRLAQMEARRYQKRKQKLRGIGMFAAVAWAVLSLYFLPSLGLLPPLYLAGILGTIYTCLHRYTVETHRRFVQLLERHSEDVRFLGVVLTLLNQGTHDLPTSRSLMALLKRLLPQVRAKQAVALKPEQMRVLLGLLNTPYEDTERTFRVLQALGQIGDESALPYIEPLAAGTIKQLNSDWSPTHEMKRIQQAAQEGLASIHAHLRQARQAQTLLRASDASTAVVSDLLLRPTQAVVYDTPPEHLLRAVPAEADSADTTLHVMRNP
ncbi:MAG TPA: hypothetical protein VFB21_21130 [Chthonomonadaceae bacterium]|nr:hypothetical protein [Chthonomonadaceae bacterium]